MKDWPNNLTYIQQINMIKLTIRDHACDIAKYAEQDSLSIALNYVCEQAAVEIIDVINRGQI